MNIASIIISGACIAVIGLCLYVTVKSIKRQLDGKGCGNCSECKSICSRRTNRK